MHVIRICLFTLLISSLIISCSHENGRQESLIEEEIHTFKSISFEELYSMDIPENMKSTESLSDHADIQFTDIFRGQRLLVEHRNRKEIAEMIEVEEGIEKNASLLSNYADLRFKKIKNGLIVEKNTPLISCSINGLDALVAAIDARCYGTPEKLSYWIAFVEGSDHVYTLIVWSPEHLKRHFEHDANKIIRSFKERGFS